MDDPGPNWGQIEIAGKRRESDEFGRLRSDPNLFPGRSFFWGERLMRRSVIVGKSPKGVLGRVLI